MGVFAGLDQRPAAAVGTVVTCDLEQTDLTQLLKLVDSTPQVIYVRHAGSERHSWGCEHSMYEFEALPGGSALVNEDFQRLVRLLRCSPAPCLGPGSYFVSLTFPE